jgi:hypothetical protein
MSHFFLMPDRKGRHRSLVNAIPNDISAVTEVDQPLPKLLRKIIDHSPEAGVPTEYLHALPNSLASPTRRIGALGAQETPLPL